MDFSYFWLIPSIFGIAIMDYYLFSRWLACPICFEKQKHPVWYTYLLPSLLEILLFLAGFAIGKS